MKLFAFRLLLFCLPLFAFAQEKPIIMLDAGHGGKDEGTRVRNLVEKQLTLRTAYLTKSCLEKLGYRVIMTRARDIFLPLGTRVKLANKRPNSLFVSIHYNSAKSLVAKGVEVYYYGKGDLKRKEASKQMAQILLAEMVSESGASSRGIKQGNFQVIREILTPAVLIEAGFITNSDERNLIAQEAYLAKLAKGIALGIDKYVQSH